VTVSRAELNPLPSHVPLIELQHVSKSYSVAAEGPPLTVLEDINLEVRSGEMLALLGQSGCGKSTVLRLMAGLTSPTEGTVLSHGKPLTGINPHLSIVFQSFALYPWLTVEQNVRVGANHRRLTGKQEREEVEQALELIGLSGYENAYPKELSGGMRQRVGFARALVAKPEALLMDEAFSALDVLTAENLRTEVVQLWQDTRTPELKSIFFVTHNIAEAVFMATRIVVITPNPGRIKHVIANPLPYPRDVNSAEFSALVTQIHEAITTTVMPDAPAPRRAPPPSRVAAGLEPARVALSVQPPRAPIESIPNVPVGPILGLLEILKDSREVINLFELSARIGAEFGETIAIAKAAEILDLVDTPKHNVELTPLGREFLSAGITERKRIFARELLRLRLFQIITGFLREAPKHRLDADELRVELALLLPYDQPDKLLQTIVAWGRYGEVIDFDEKTNAVILPVSEDESAASSAD